MNKWSNAFVNAIIKYSSIIRIWMTQSNALRNIIFHIQEIYTPFEFPYTENRYVESSLVSITIYRVFDDSCVNWDKLKSFHVRETTSLLIFDLIIDLWSNHISICTHDRYCYFDSLITHSVLDFPGVGIGYLCLLISQNVRINHWLYDQIDTSYYLSPELPFSSKERQCLLKIVSGEDRLRLALLLAHRFGKLARKYKIRLNVGNLHNLIWTILDDFIFANEDKVNKDSKYKDNNDSKDKDNKDNKDKVNKGKDTKDSKDKDNKDNKDKVNKDKDTKDSKYKDTLFLREFGEFDIILVSLLMPNKCISPLSSHRSLPQQDYYLDGPSNSWLIPITKAKGSTLEIIPETPSSPELASASSLLDISSDVYTCTDDLYLYESDDWRSEENDKDNIAKDNIAKDNIAKDNIAKDNIAKDNIAKDNIDKELDNYSYEAVKKDNDEQSHISKRRLFLERIKSLF